MVFATTFKKKCDNVIVRETALQRKKRSIRCAARKNLKVYSERCGLLFRMLLFDDFCRTCSLIGHYF